MTRSSLCAIALAASLAAACPALAASSCQQWDIAGSWFFMQNGQRYGYFEIEQNGDLLVGTARHYRSSEENDLGTLDGIVRGSSIEITVYWSPHSIGVYGGEINATGRIEGVTYDKLSPGNRTNWYSADRMKCATAAATPPAPAKKKIKVLGKKKIDPNAAKASKELSVCAEGFVTRAARPADLVCVPPEARARTAGENGMAASLYDPHGAYGPESCVAGYVWREAFEGDTVCVTPQTRSLVRQENRLAASRRAGG
jgi:hypothetical protein